MPAIIIIIIIIIIIMKIVQKVHNKNTQSGK